MKKNKRSPFRRGQRVRVKNSKHIGVVVSKGPAQIGNHRTCKIPGGPLIFKEYVFIKILINNNDFICMEKISNLEPA
jgi:hypothetical protein